MQNKNAVCKRQESMVAFNVESSSADAVVRPGGKRIGGLIFAPRFLHISGLSSLSPAHRIGVSHAELMHLAACCGA